MTLTALPDTAHAVRLSTDEAAARLKVKPQTLRAAVCRNSHYCGIRPVKGPNRFLYWPADAIDRLLVGDAVPNSITGGGQP